MNRYIKGSLSLLLVGGLTGCMMDGDGMGSMQRHRAAMMGGIPDKYVEQTKLVGSASAGAPIYKQQCVACHGESGQGNGPMAQTLNPRPADLSNFSSMWGNRGKELVTWAINEGGKSYGTAMPAFKEALTPQQIQDLVAYIHEEL